MVEGSRLFSYYTRDSFEEMFSRYPELHEIALWKTDELRSHRYCEPWLNVLLKTVDR